MRLDYNSCERIRLIPLSACKLYSINLGTSKGPATQAQARLTGVIELVTENLERYEAEWRAKKLPKLQARAHSLWRQGQQEGRTDDWEWHLEHCRVYPCLLTFHLCMVLCIIRLSSAFNANCEVMKFT